jgi:hypothetical protein
MLKITVPSIELYDEEHNKFFMSKEYELQLEHSLVSLSKWESKWHKPFLTKGQKTSEEALDYVRCMTISQNVDPEAYNLIGKEFLDRVTEYIDDPMTATTFRKDQTPNSREIITAEIIYYWMISFNIPFECQKWHLNRLLTLINVCNIKNQPAKKVSKKELIARNKALNEARKSQLNTKG